MQITDFQTNCVLYISIGKTLTNITRLAATLLLLSGCTVYNPAFLGSELPVIPVQPLDTVATSVWSAHGGVGQPLTYGYGEDDTNELVSFGIYGSYTFPYPELKYSTRQQGFSVTYGAMAYTGRYRVTENNAPRTAYRYHGGMAHAGVRYHLGGTKQASYVLETSANLFFEGGEYFREFNPVSRAGIAGISIVFFSLPLVASFQGSFVPRFQLNRHWSITSAYTVNLSGYGILSYYQFSGAVAVSRQRFTLWSRAALHTGTGSFFGPSRWTLNTGLSYHFIRR